MLLHRAAIRHLSGALQLREVRSQLPQTKQLAEGALALRRVHLGGTKLADWVAHRTQERPLPKQLSRFQHGGGSFVCGFVSMRL